MFPFDFFPFPQAWLDWNPSVWSDLIFAEQLIALAGLAIGLATLMLGAFTGRYDPRTARAGFCALLVALNLAAFGPWLWVLAGVLLVAYLLIYWVLWRFLVRNIWAAIFGSPKPEPGPKPDQTNYGPE